MEDLLSGLNEQQREAAIHNEGTLIVLAGAGCGKTKVLTSRIAMLVKSGVSPYEILAVTFTNKAADEMKKRLIPSLGEDKVKKMWVGTFHGIAGRILRADIDSFVTKDGKKYDKSFVIYDDSDMNTIIKNVLKKLNMDEKVYPVKQVRAVISDAKNKMRSAFDFATRARSYRDEQYSKVYEEYQKQLNLNNAVDFDDMLLMSCDLLRSNKEVRNKYFKRFKHILVDEFQDTNLTQYNFIKSIYTDDNPMFTNNGRSLCTVGDIDQSIYGWRGADYRILLNMQVSFPDSKLVKLEQNYRSVGTILTAANSVIENNVERTEKNLYSNLGKGEPIEVYEAQDEDDEADYVIRSLLSLRNKYKLSECCVLYRTNSQSRKAEEACIANGIPYKIVGGLKFYDRAEIKDLIAYLKFIYNHSDSQSLARIINVPKRSIGETTVKKLRELSASTEIPVYEIISEIDEYDDFSASTKTKLKKFKDEIDILSSKKDSMILPEYLSFILETTGYLRELKEDDSPQGETRIDNLQELINVAGEFEPEESDNIIGEFLSRVALVSDIDSYEDENNALTLMTLHSAKGLEFDVVWLTGLDEGVFPHNRSINGIKNPESEIEEERRLMYVGVTRARKRLFLTHAERRKMWGNYQYYNPSRFLAEIPDSVKSYGQSSPKKYGSFSSNNSNRQVEKKSVTFSDGKINSVSSFGKGFLAPKAFIKKKAQPTEPVISEEEKIKRILAQSPIKKKLEEKKLRAETEKQEIKIDKFEKGDRVFHSKFGVGTITEVKTVGGCSIYIADFGRVGLKSFDAAFADLKKF